MRRRESLILIAGLAAFTPGYVWGQPDNKPTRIGYLAPGHNQRLLTALLSGLRDLNYIEGRNLKLEYRSAEGRADLLAPLAAELVQLSPDVIVTLGAAATRAASRATSMIPIVFAPAGDAVHAGLVQSLAHPEGNLTGVSINTWVLNQKRLEILKETFQRIKRVAILGNGSNPANLGQWDQFKYSGQALGLDLLPFMIGGIAKLVVDFDRIATSGVDALAVLPDATFDTAREQIVALAAKHRLATMYEHRAFVEAGGLMSYGPNLDQISYRAATVVDKLLKGAKPADLPVEQPTSYELIINLKAVKALNITIEEAVMSRADEVIE